MDFNLFFENPKVVYLTLRSPMLLAFHFALDSPAGREVREALGGPPENARDGPVGFSDRNWRPTWGGGSAKVRVCWLFVWLLLS